MTEGTILDEVRRLLELIDEEEIDARTKESKVASITYLIFLTTAFLIAGMGIEASLAFPHLSRELYPIGAIGVCLVITGLTSHFLLRRRSLFVKAWRKRYHEMRDTLKGHLTEPPTS